MSATIGESIQELWDLQICDVSSWKQQTELNDFCQKNQSSPAFLNRGSAEP